MKKSVIVLMSLLCSVGCNRGGLSKSQKVASEVTIGNHKLIVCDRLLLKDTVSLPLSYFAEELKMVKLEMSDEAVVSNWGAVVVGEQYVLIGAAQNNPSKLFTIDGKFVTNIGSIGRGPGEYRNVYDQILDEKNNRIYLLPWSSQSILVYDLKGNVLDPIRLPVNVPKGKFFIDPSGTVSVFTLSFTGSQYVAWTQTMSGEVISGIEPGHFAVRPDFSHEILSGKNISGMDVFMLNIFKRQDTLYHYNSKTNRLLPQFALKQSNTEFVYGCIELPKHYMGVFSEMKQVSANMSQGYNHTFFVVEKSTLNGSYFKLKNDYIGDMEIEWPTERFSNGYFIQNYDPGDLLEDVEKALKNKDLSSAMRQKLTQLKNSISEKDNNYIFYSRLKK